MSKRISWEEAKAKLEREKEIQAQIKAGTYHSTRFERRRQKRLQHEQSFIQLLIHRKGYYKQKEKKGKEQQKLESQKLQANA